MTSPLMLAEARTTTGIASPTGLSLAAWITILACVWAASTAIGAADELQRRTRNQRQRDRPGASVLAGDIDIDLKRATLLERAPLVVDRHVHRRRADQHRDRVGWLDQVDIWLLLGLGVLVKRISARAAKKERIDPRREVLGDEERGTAPPSPPWVW